MVQQNCRRIEVYAGTCNYLLTLRRDLRALSDYVKSSCVLLELLRLKCGYSNFPVLLYILSKSCIDEAGNPGTE